MREWRRPTLHEAAPVVDLSAPMQSTLLSAEPKSNARHCGCTLRTRTINRTKEVPWLIPLAIIRRRRSSA